MPSPLEQRSQAGIAPCPDTPDTGGHLPPDRDSGHPCQPTPKAMYSVPSGCLDPLRVLCSSTGQALPVHALPHLGEWLSAAGILQEPSVLAARSGYKPLNCMASRAGLNPGDFGSHSLRRGGASKLRAAGASPEQRLLGLQHESPTSAHTPHQRLQPQRWLPTHGAKTPLDFAVRRQGRGGALRKLGRGHPYRSRQES